MSETPIYTSVLTDQRWSPDELSEPFNLEAVIASSYGRGLVRRPAAKKAAAPRKPRRKPAPRKASGAASTVTEGATSDA